MLATIEAKGSVSRASSDVILDLSAPTHQSRKSQRNSTFSKRKRFSWQNSSLPSLDTRAKGSLASAPVLNRGSLRGEILRTQGPRGVSDDGDAEIREGARFHALLEAMADPLRSRLLIAIEDHRATGVSVRELADELGEPSRRVRYHIDALASQGLIAVAEERPRRGVVERYYRTERKPRISLEEMDLVEEEQGRKISMQILKAILSDASAAAAAGTFGTRADEATIRIRGAVDRQGWRELHATHTWALGNLEAIIDKAEARLMESDESPIPAVSALLLFQAPG